MTALKHKTIPLRHSKPKSFTDTVNLANQRVLEYYNNYYIVLAPYLFINNHIQSLISGIDKYQHVIIDHARTHISGKFAQEQYINIHTRINKPALIPCPLSVGRLLRETGFKELLKAISEAPENEFFDNIENLFYYFLSLPSEVLISKKTRNILPGIINSLFHWGGDDRPLVTFTSRLLFLEGGAVETPLLDNSLVKNYIKSKPFFDARKEKEIYPQLPEILRRNISRISNMTFSSDNSIIQTFHNGLLVRELLRPVHIQTKQNVLAPWIEQFKTRPTFFRAMQLPLIYKDDLRYDLLKAYTILVDILSIED
ncbi:MAG: hypothetical protein ABIH39_02250 [Candidatus Margulisiibacteriota bacterium]